MADTEFVLSEDRTHSFIRDWLSDCVIASDGRLPFAGPPDNSLLGLVNARFHQLFIKHSSFASDEFTIKHTFVDGKEISVVDQFEGCGHLKMLTFPLRQTSKPAFRLTIGYQSFFVLKDAHIPPSVALKNFYTSMIRAAQKDTERLELWPGRSTWFQQELLENDPELLEKVRASFRRA